jgi:hypothetical protein
MIMATKWIPSSDGDVRAKAPPNGIAYGPKIMFSIFLKYES